jgi:hypothetical protein
VVNPVEITPSWIGGDPDKGSARNFKSNWTCATRDDSALFLNEVLTTMHAPNFVECDTAEVIFSILSSSTYRKNSLARMNLADCRRTMLHILRRCITNEQPIQLTLLAFPFKVPNPAKVGGRKLPDFAELAAIYHMRSLKFVNTKSILPNLLRLPERRTSFGVMTSWRSSASVSSTPQAQSGSFN